MKRENLIEQIRKKKSFLCVGLDPDLKKLPQHLLKFSDPIFEFNKAIIDATSNYCVAYKPNTAFYEAHGVMGWQSLEKTIVYLKENYPNHFTIADAKRGDIGNTSSMYAQTFFQTMNFDAVTVAPYMGSDSVKPFLNFENKWVVLLALTSNEGAYDFQTEDCSGLRLFEKVLARSMEWGSADNLMYVVGATKAEMLSEIRKIVPDSFLLIPGVGAQGGSLDEVCKYGLNKDIGLLVNASRSIIYASSEIDFELAAATEAKNLSSQMNSFVT